MFPSVFFWGVHRSVRAYRDVHVALEANLVFERLMAMHILLYISPCSKYRQLSTMLHSFAHTRHGLHVIDPSIESRLINQHNDCFVCDVSTFFNVDDDREGFTVV